MPLLSKKSTVLLFFFYFHIHILLFFEIIYKGNKNFIMPSKSIPGKEKMIFLNQVLISLVCFNALTPVHRAIIAYSSGPMLARMAVYVWPMDLAAKVVYLVYRYGVLKLDTPTSLPLFSGKVDLMDFGALLLVGPGLKLVLEETQENDERALQTRNEVVEGLDKKLKESGRRSQTEEDEEEPLSLAGASGKRWIFFGTHFLLRVSQNWSLFQSAETNPSFVQVALIFHICMNVFGLFVITRKSKRLCQALLFAMICGVLIDVALTAQGLSRFIEQEGLATSTSILTDLTGLSQWPWIYPTPFITWVELSPIFEMRGAIRDFNRSHNQDIEKAAIAIAVDGERQQTEAGPSPSQEAGVVHTP
ncbi:MAG: hypothetical protein J3R72DRAFT_101848 [Linnemannia gamsii]|nr:MAG: hypothetical protein J3R72DRAFT_101848 [Linnemannia gamsii]